MTTSSVDVLSAAVHHPGLAVGLGLASAGGFAVSNALQHRVAGTIPATVHRATDVLRHLVRKPVWLGATVISFTAMVLHALALRSGSIALVQPLMLVGVVLAVPLRAALERRVPPWPEVRAVVVTVVGLAVFLGSADPGVSTDAPRLASALVVVVVGGLVAACALRLCRSRLVRDPRLQASFLGAAAGVLFGVTAGLLKLIASGAGGSEATVLVGLLVVLAAVGVAGTALNQRAYQLAPLAFSMPVVNVVDVLVAVFFGAAVFGELPGHTPEVLLLQLAALGCVAVGLRGIALLGNDGAWNASRVCPAGGAA
ncbi:MAG TPA: DMT family transporter [Marmoricola sp.]|nr:DMT family transporter [Marmoricola sp.]